MPNCTYPELLTGYRGFARKENAMTTENMPERYTPQTGDIPLAGAADIFVILVKLPRDGGLSTTSYPSIETALNARPPLPGEATIHRQAPDGSRAKLYRWVPDTEKQAGHWEMTKAAAARTAKGK
jgi:hypothetical protein